jgi:hypothetical protein
MATRDIRWFAVTAALTVAVSSLLLLLPLSGRSLLDAEGPGVIVTLAVPVLICAIPLLAPARHRRAAAWISAVLLGIGVILGLLSVGVYFVPSLILLIIGANRVRPGTPVSHG